MKSKNNKHVILITSLLIALIAGSAVIAYFTSWSDAVSIFLKKFYPSAIVASKPVSIEDSDEFVRLAQKTDLSLSSSQAFANFIERQKQEALMKQLDLKVESDAIPDEYLFYTKGNEEAYSQLLESYFDNSKAKFVNNVVYPQVVEAKLRIYFNSKFDLNKDAYAQAQSILDQIKKGAKFEDLAKQYSADKQTAQIGGDLGFFEHGQILPELEKQISIAKFGEVDPDIVVTRFGYEIIYPIEISQQGSIKKWHAKHILIETTGYDDWLKSQLEGIKVSTIKNY